MKDKRIAFVRLRYLPPSETFIYEELKNITNYRPLVFARKFMNRGRFPYHPIYRLPRNIHSMVRLFKRKKVKLIHARFGNSGVKLMRVKKRLKIPMITSFHGFDLPSKKRNTSYHRQLPKLFKICDKFTVPSRHMKYKLMRWGCPHHKIKIQYSGIDLNKFQYISRIPKTRDIRIIGVGRLHKKKGFKYLIKAFRRVVQVYPDTKLTIVGKGSERAKLMRWIRFLKLTNHVKLIGDLPHQEIVQQLHQADIFCLPSITTKDGNQEGIPNAIKEAMATGLPIVATRHGGIPELVTDQVEGFLVREKDSKALSENLINLIENPHLREEFGRRGRSKVETCFNSAKQVQRLESIYEQVMKKGER